MCDVYFHSVTTIETIPKICFTAASSIWFLALFCCVATSKWILVNIFRLDRKWTQVGHLWQLYHCMPLHQSGTSNPNMANNPFNLVYIFE